MCVTAQMMRWDKRDRTDVNSDPVVRLQLRRCFDHCCQFNICSVCVRSGVNMFLRKMAAVAASSPSVEISQEGETLSIKTTTSIRTTYVSFTVGQSFNDATVDGRPCTVRTSLLPILTYLRNKTLTHTVVRSEQLLHTHTQHVEIIWVQPWW